MINCFFILMFFGKVSILEIYNEKLKDLIDPKKMNLRIREDKHQGVFVEDLSEWYEKHLNICIKCTHVSNACMR